ncbi:MAG: hypothetical protein WAN74_01505 [Thermoplasmata archaeon]
MQVERGRDEDRVSLHRPGLRGVTASPPGKFGVEGRSKSHDRIDMHVEQQFMALGRHFDLHPGVSGCRVRLLG